MNEIKPYVASCVWLLTFNAAFPSWMHAVTDECWTRTPLCGESYLIYGISVCWSFHTKMPQTQWLTQRTWIFLTIWSCSGSQGWFLVRSLPVCSPLRAQAVRGQREISGDFLGQQPHWHRTPVSWSHCNSLLKAPSPNMVASGDMASTYQYRGRVCNVNILNLIHLSVGRPTGCCTFQLL